jgi:hypothetical protein
LTTAAGAHELYDAVAARIIVWVEESLAEVYLNGLWEDNEIRIMVAGCAETVRAVTEDARKGGFKHVFGVRDKDFGTTNFDKWRKYKEKIDVFRLPRHEMENYLLDWPALAGCTENRRNKSAQEIEVEIKDVAASLAWWLATKWTLSDLSANLSKGFPREPGQMKIEDDKEALNYILTCGWYQYVCKLPKTSLTKAKIKSLLTKYHERVHRALSTKEWIEVFPGKELLRKARSFIGHPKRKGTKTDADIDLAKAIAEWQRPNPEKEEDRRPKDLMTLRNSLHQRVPNKS